MFVAMEKKLLFEVPLTDDFSAGIKRENLPEGSGAWDSRGAAFGFLDHDVPEVLFNTNF